MAVTVYTKTGAKSSAKATLPKAVFGVKDISGEVLHQVYASEAHNARNAVATTKTRGQVRGGGRKPWRQKGTGRARAGSIRSPLWKGGGVIFGPSAARNHTRSINKNVRKQALAQALSMAMANGRVAIIENINANGKTKDIAALLKKISFNRGLVIAAEVSPELLRSFANVADVDVCSGRTLSTADVLNSYQLLIVKDALPVLEERLGASS